MAQPLIDKVENLLGDFYRSRGFTVTCGENQASLFGTTVRFDSEKYVIGISRDRGDELIDVGVKGNKDSFWPLGHLVAYLEGKRDAYSVTSLEAQAEWLKTRADQVLDEAMLKSKALRSWAAESSRRMFGQRSREPKRVANKAPEGTARKLAAPQR